MEFKLKFKNGVVSGKGSDPIGKFTWSGVYDPFNKTVNMTKQYEGKHSVQYSGRKCGPKAFEGQWNTEKGHGTFYLQKGKKT